MMFQRITIGGLSALSKRPVVETGPPLLFVHGYFGQAIAFERMMSWFVANGHWCCAPDLRGHGESISSQDLGKLSIHDYVDDVCQVAREMDRPVVLGHSMGGLIAQLVASKQYARGIVLLASAPPRGISIMSLKLAIAQARYMPAIATSRAVQPGHADLRAIVVNRVPEAEREAVLDMMVPDSGRAGREMTFFGVPVDKREVRVPVLVASGDKDLFIPLSRAKRIAERYGARILVAPGRAHMLIIEPGYEEICDWIETWMREVVEMPTAVASDA